MTTKIPIVLIHPADPFGRKIGGSETFAENLIKYSPDDFSIDYIGISSDTREREPGRWQTVRLGSKKINFLPLFFEKRENRKHLIPVSLRFVLSLKRVRYDFLQRCIVFNRIEPAVLFRKKNIPNCILIHNDIEREIKGKDSEVLWSKCPWLYFAFERQIFKNADRIFTVSKNTLDFYARRYPNMKVSLIHTWFDPQIHYPPTLPTWVLKERLKRTFDFVPCDKKWILYVGRLEQHKAPLRLLETFSKYGERDPNSCLIIVGDGNLRPQVEAYVSRPPLKGHVFIIEYLDRRALAEFYRASDLLLLTSNFEGMPMVVLEALGCGLPVVSTDVGEVSRVVKSGFSGEVAGSFETADIVESMNKVLHNPDVYKCQNCVSTVSEYTPEIILEPLYQEIRTIVREGSYRRL